MTSLLQEGFGLLLHSAVLLIFALLALRLTRRRGPAVQSLVGRAALAGVALLLITTPLTGHLPALWRVTIQEPTPRQVASPPETGGGRGLAVGARPIAPALPTAVPALPPNIMLDAARTEGAINRAPTPPTPTSAPSRFGRGSDLSRGGSLLPLWGLVSTALLLWLGVCQWHLIRLRRTAHPITSGPAFETLAALTPCPPRLLFHPAVLSPFLAGIRHPAIFLPDAYETEFGPAALRAILAHELAHLARRDNAWTLASRLLTALLWPQPLLWLLCRRLEQIGEEACDEAVLARDCSPRAYADCLLTLAERRPLGRCERALGAGVAPFRSSLGRRIARILDKGTYAMSTTSLRLRLGIAAGTFAALLGGALLISSAPAQSPQQGPVPSATEQQKAAQQQDMMNLHTIAIALNQYVQDHDEFYPNADHWMDDISVYLKDKTVFFDPFHPGAQRYGYAFNRAFSEKSLAAVAHPSEAVTVFDSSLGTRNADDTGQSLRANTLGNTFGSSYLFADGHITWRQKAEQPSFAVQWDRRFLQMTPAHPSAGLPAVLHNPPPALSGQTMTVPPLSLSSATSPDPALNQARFLAGLTAVQGPGVVVTLRDSKHPLPSKMPSGMTPPNLIHDTDINQVVNEMKAAGAEAIAINDQRLVATSPIRCAGPTIMINYTPLTSPFIIKAIGSPKTLRTALNVPGGVAAQIKGFDPAMFSIREATTLTLPPYSGGVQPRYAKPISLGANTGRSQQLMQQQVRVQEREEVQVQINAVSQQVAVLTAQTQQMRAEMSQKAKNMNSPTPIPSLMRDWALGAKTRKQKAALKNITVTETLWRQEIIAAQAKAAALPPQDPRRKAIEESIQPIENKIEFIEQVHQYQRKWVALYNQEADREGATSQQLHALRMRQRALQVELSTLNAEIAHEHGQTPGH